MNLELFQRLNFPAFEPPTAEVVALGPTGAGEIEGQSPGRVAKPAKLTAKAAHKRTTEAEPPPCEPPPQRAGWPGALSPLCMARAAEGLGGKRHTILH